MIRYPAKGMTNLTKITQHLRFEPTQKHAHNIAIGDKLCNMYEFSMLLKR